ncbi:MAG: VTT domain-containing protein [Betaproteobacteria bacterium]|nr:VTT domain-containing protein [Betaproteobacteria bacterium]
MTVNHASPARYWIRIGLLILLGIAIVLAYTNRNQLNAGAIVQAVHSAGILAPLAFMAIYAAATVALVPGSVLTLAGGALFGPLAGTFYSLTGATIGATLAFLAGRHMGLDWVRARVGGRAAQIIEGVEREDWRFVALMRLVPLVPFNLLNYALGLTRIRLTRYVLTTYIAMLPGAFAYTYLGYAGREAAAGSSGLIQKGLLALALLAAVALLPRLIQRIRKTRPAGPDKLLAAELKEQLDQRPDEIVVLDVRSPKDYAGPGGHIPNAKNIPLAQLSARLGELSPYRDRPLAVVCNTNRMSGQAVVLLRDAGFRQVMLVEDGMASWSRQGFAIEKP